MSSADFEASVGDRLGGRWAISWLGFVITAPISLAVLALTAQRMEDVPAWLLIGVCGVGIGGAWSLLLHRTAFRDRALQPVPLTWVIGASVTAALLFVGTALVLGASLDVLNDDVIAVRFIALFVVIAFWGPLLTLTLDSHWRYRVEREALIRQEVQQALASEQERELLKDVRESVLADVNSHVTSANRSLIDQIDRLMEAGASDTSSVAGELRATAESSVRSYSHQLEERARIVHRTPGFISALLNVVRYQPFRPLAVSVVYVITTTPREIAEEGLMTGLGLLVVTVTLIFAIMLWLNRTMRRWPQHHASIFIGGLVLIQAPSFVLAPIRGAVTGQASSMADVAVSAIFGTFVVFATSAFGAWNRTRQQVLAEFRNEVDQETIATLVRSEALAKASREAAIILHGSVQTQLHACALAIEEATRTGNLMEVNRALVQARAVLENPGIDGVSEVSGSLQQLLGARVSQWNGLLNVLVSLDAPTADIQGEMATHVAAVVEEGIANAFHHGSARNVEAVVVDDGDGVVVTVTDDGTGPAGGSPGLGSRLFARGGSPWRLEAVDGGARLNVRVQIRGVRPLSS